MRTLYVMMECLDFMTFLANTKGTKRSRTRTDSYSAGQSVGESVAMTTMHPHLRRNYCNFQYWLIRSMFYIKKMQKKGKGAIFAQSNHVLLCVNGRNNGGY